MLCQRAPSPQHDSVAASALPLAMIVAVTDADMAREVLAMLASQEWTDTRVIYPVSAAVAAAREDGAHLVFIRAGMSLTAYALERAWWALETRPAAHFVAFGDERGARTPMLEAVTACVVVRSTSVTQSAEQSDARWPGVAPVFGALELGQRGHMIREPMLVRPHAAVGPDTPAMRAVAELRSRGLSDAVLGDAGHDNAPQPEPLQCLDERPLPATSARARVNRGKHRVLALLQGFPMGGYTAFNTDFLPRLVSRGHSVTVCTTEVWRSEWQLENVRAATQDVVHANGIVPLESMPRFVSYLIESRGIDVVLISHSMAGYRMLAWLRRRHPNTAFLDYVHTDWFESQMYGSYAAMGAAHADWMDVQVASSHVLASDLIERGARPETMRAVNINLDVSDWDPSRFPNQAVRQTLGCKPGQPLVLYAGRVSPEKRPLLAVECWRELIAAGVDARFAVMGTGQQLTAMIDAVAEAGLTHRVEFLGELQGDMLRHVYSAADVYHAPSEIEGIARSLFEAMAMQCVPVVADVGGQSELVTAECGALVPHGPNEVARYVSALVAATRPASMLRLQKASRQRIVRHFNSALCVAGFEAAFDLAVEQRAVAALDGAPAESASAAREMALAGLETARRHFWRAQGR